MKKVFYSALVLATVACSKKENAKKEIDLGDKVFTNLSYAEKKTNLINIASSDNKFFDADNDGDMDLFINGWTREDKDFNTVARLYINDGEGNFSESKESSFKGFEYGSVDIADIDNDGDNDIVFSGSFNGNVELGVESAFITKVYKNEEGVFTEDTNQKLPDEVGVLKLTDINNDKSPDLVYSTEETLETYLNDGKGNFKLSENPNLEPVDDAKMVSFDIDNDADNDLIVLGIVEYVKPVVHVYVNESGKFKAKENNMVGFSQGVMEYADIDNDKDFDLIISGIQMEEEQSDGDYLSHVYKNDGKGGFEAHETIIPLYNNGQCLFFDVDNDHDLDVLMSGSRFDYESDESHDGTDLFLNDGKGNFKLHKRDFMAGFSEFSMAFGDVNYDGKTDVLVTCYAQDPKYKNAEVEYDESGFEIEHNIPFTRLFINRCM